MFIEFLCECRLRTANFWRVLLNYNVEDDTRSRRVTVYDPCFIGRIYFQEIKVYDFDINCWNSDKVKLLASVSLFNAGDV